MTGETIWALTALIELFLLIVVAVYAVWSNAQYMRAKELYARLANRSWEKLKVHNNLGYIVCDGSCDTLGRNLSIPYGDITTRTLVLAIQHHYRAYHVGGEQE
jgi:hypothetical protein